MHLVAPGHLNLEALMAKTKLAAPIAGIRGTVGGLIYSANGSGTYVRAWNPPSNPQSVNQMVERSFLAQMPALWNPLTPVQRTAWDTFAALPAQELFDSLGQSYFASGWNWFCKCNVRLLRVGRAPIAATPVLARPAAPTIDAFRVTLPGTDTDLATGGIPSASSFTAPFLPALAFNDSTADGWVSAAMGLPAWIQYILTATQIIRRYDIYIHSLIAGGNFRDWTFEGKNNGGWDILHTVTDFSPSAIGWHRFYIANETTYTTYRWNVTDVHTPAPGFASARELALFTGLVDGSVVVYPEDEFTTIPYDLILHISMTDSQSKAVQYPGFYEVLAVQAPGRWYELFQTELQTVFGTVLEGRRWFAKFFKQTTEGIRSAAATDADNTRS